MSATGDPRRWEFDEMTVRSVLEAAPLPSEDQRRVTLEALESLRARLHTLERERVEAERQRDLARLARKAWEETYHGTCKKLAAAQALVHTLEQALEKMEGLAHESPKAASIARLALRAVVLEGREHDKQQDSGFIHQPTTRIMGVEQVDLGKPLGVGQSPPCEGSGGAS